MLTVKLSIDDGKGKKANLEISEADNFSKLVIIQNVFNLFGVGTDVMEMTNDYRKFGAGYSKFFNQVDPIEPNKDNLEIIDIEQQLTESYENNKDEIESTYKEVEDHIPEYILTGIKFSDGKKRYQLYYICSVCDHRGKHYVYENSKKTWCHSCKFEMEILTATTVVGERDRFGNFFIAGETDYLKR